MDTVVNRLLDVDKEARGMLDEARQFYDHTLLEIEKEKKKLLADYNEKVETHVRELRAELAGEVDEAVVEAQKRADVLLEAMRTRYDQHHEQWENELLRRCIGR